MIRLAIVSAAAVCTAAAAFAATELLGDEPEVIEIRVAPSELADCRDTLRQVGQMPVVTDEGTPMLFGANDDLPGVVCVADI
ncbi:hypothetical protein [Salipiger sp.]|uniref:hypothetical protein n=1 Tax=Salipiger sp. TaxID=2078585 RepID=UPI003A97282E